MRGSKVLKWVVIAGVGLRLCLWIFQSWPEGDDGLRYLTESINLVDHGVFSTAQSGVPMPSAHDMPLWPGIMAVVYWATGSVPVTQHIAGLINILLVVAGIMAMIALLKNKPFSFDDRQITLGLAVLLFMPDAVVYSLFHMPDQLAVSAVIVALWLYFKGVNGNAKYLIGSFIVFVVAIYAKPICIPLALAFIMALALVYAATWKKKLAMVAAGIAIVTIGLSPWVARNKLAFGTAGITSISGTNLYGCNWGRLAQLLPVGEREAALADMERFENEIADCDSMKRSKLMGKYARVQLLAHLPEYMIYTAKTHPRLYAGTGTVALLRYLGMERTCDALDNMWSSGVSRGYKVQYDTPYTFSEKAIGAGVQIVSWMVLLGGYVLVAVGAAKSICQYKGLSLGGYLLVLSPLFSIILLAAVIGPITATRYRFIMIPFFAILAGYSAMRAQSQIKID